jgi:hypothetical protein
MKTTLTVQISVESDASEADIHDHLTRFVEDVKGMATQSWYQRINTDWDKSHRAKIEVSVSE